MNTQTSPLFFERYELKYLVPLELVEKISNYVSIFCDEDYYSQISPDGFYTINSLYLDNPKATLLNNKFLGSKQRFSLRIRSYGDHPKEDSVYFEIKEKDGEFVKKKRASIKMEGWQGLIDNPILVESVAEPSRRNLKRFLFLQDLYGVSPQILTQYRRRAFLSREDDYARVTFDRDLRFHLEGEYTAIPDNDKMSFYDTCEVFDDFRSFCILELKCESRVPIWFLDMIKRFELTRESFSKFAMSMQEARAQSLGQIARHYI